MTNNLHPQNVGKPAAQLIEQAQKALLAAIDRHFKNNGATGPTLRTCIPAQWDDTDVIVMDALRVAKEAIEQRDELLADMKRIQHSGLLQPPDYHCVYCHATEEDINHEIIHKQHCVHAIARRAIAKAEGGQS